MSSEMPRRAKIVLSFALLLAAGATAAFANAGPLQFFSLPPGSRPCRIYDSRNDAPGPLAGGTATNVPMTAVRCNVPTTAKAVAVNVTITQASADGFVIVYGGPTEPLTSNVNFRQGQTRANNAVVQLAADGSVTIGVHMTGTVHVILDVSGYFQSGGPVLTAGGGTPTFTEGGPPVAVDPGITVTDLTSTTLASATVTITNLLDSGSEVLAATTTGTSITANYVAPTLTLTGVDTLANYQTVLRSVTYSNSSQNPSTTPRHVAFSANDGTSSGNTVTTTVDVTPVDNAPALTAGGGSPTFTEGGGPVAVDPGITATDVDSTNLASAVVTITNLLDSGAETLAANTAGTSIVAVYSAPTLTLTGSDTVAHYQQVLRSVTYNNSSQNPTTTARAISFKVNDGTLDSNVVTTSVAITAVDNAPVLTAGGGSPAFTEGGGPVAVDPLIAVSDVDSTNLASATVTITNLLDAGAETLAANTAGTSIVAIYSAPTLTLTGSDTLAHYQQVLRSVTYNNSSQNPSTTSRVISFVANDGSLNSNTVMKSVSITAVDNAPVLTAGGGSPAFTEGGGPVAVDPAIAASDVDSPNLASATVTITNLLDSGAETLAANTAGTSIVAMYTAPTLTLTGADTVAHYQQVLRSVTYDNSSMNPNTTARMISFVANDGSLNSNTVIKSVSVTAVNNAPVLTAGGGTAAFTEGGGPVTVDPAISVSDVDSPNLASAAVTITNLLDAGAETLAANTAGTSIVAVYSAPTLTLTGADTQAHYQQVLRSVTYNNSSQNPSATSRVISFTANDGALNSNTVTTTVTVTPVDNAPVAVDDSATVVEDSGANSIDVLANDTDIDGGPKSVASVTQPANGAVVITGGGTGVDYTPNANYCETHVTTVAQYRLGENDGGAVSGNVGNDPTTALVGGIDLSRTGSPTYTATTPAAITSSLAMHFDGSSDFYGNTASVASTAVDNFGIEAWAKSDGSTAGNGLIAYNGNPSLSGWGIFRQGNKWGYIYGAVTGGATAVVQPGVWTHLALVRDGGTTTFYVNGFAVGTPLLTPPNAPSTTGGGGTMIGGNASGIDHFDGAIDEVRIFTFAAGQFSPSDLTLSGSPTRTSPDTFTYSLSPGGSTATVSVTVTCVDDPPVAVDDAATVTEGAPATAIDVLINDTDIDGGPRSVASVTQPTNGTVVITGGGTGLTYQPSAGYCNNPPGTTPDTFTYTLAPGSSTATVSVTVTCVNQAPSFTKGPDQTVLEDAGPQTVTGWATAISPGPPNESGQTVHFNVTGNTNPGLFSAGPAVSPAGTLTFTPAANANGTATITIRLQDDGGTANGGQDTSAPQSFVINVTAVNDAPSFTKGPDQSANDNVGAVSVPGWATAISAGPPDESGQTLNFVVTGNTDPSIFAAGPAVSATGTLTYTPAIVPFGTHSSTITLTLHDNGGTANGGVDTSAPQSFVVSITHVNIPPMIVGSPKETFDTVGDTQLEFKAVKALSPSIFVAGNLVANFTDPDNGPSSLTAVAVVGGATTNGGKVDIATNGEFTFTPKAGDLAASDSFQYQITDGAATVTRTVTVNLKSRVWYVKNNAAGGGQGRSNDPFNTLAAAQTASLAGDYIFVYGGDGTTTGQAAGITLKANQKFYGEAFGLTIANTINGVVNPTLVPANVANRPKIDNPAAGGNAVSVPDVAGVEVRGFSIAANTNAVNVTTTAANSGGATVTDNVITGTTAALAQGIKFAAGGTGTMTATVQNNTVTAVGNAIEIKRTAASGASTVDVDNNTSLLSSGASGLVIDGSGGGTTTITGFSGNTVHQNTAGSGILVTSAKFDAVPGTAAYDTVSGGTTLIGVSGNGVGGSGMVLSSVTGDLAFTNFSVFADGGAGVSISGTGAVNTGAGTGTRVTVGAGVATVEATNGPAVSVTNSTLDFQLVSAKSTNSATTGVSLDTVFGTFSAGSGSTITNATGTDFSINAGTAAVTYNGTITDTTGRLVSVTSATGGTKSFTGTISDTGSGTGTGIFLNANTGATISFTNTLTLSTGSSNAFTATGGGTVSSTDANSTVVTTTGTAINVANTTIGASGLKFKKVSAGTAASGPANGIVVNNTGTGVLTITGDGSTNSCKTGTTTCSGGTIQKTTADGISLTSSRVNLSLMWIKDNANSGIKGTSVSGLTLTDVLVQNNTNSTGEQAGILLNDLSDPNSQITRAEVSGSTEDNVRIHNSTMTGTVTLSNCTIKDNSTGSGNNGVFFQTNTTGNLTGTVQNSTLSGNRTIALSADSGDGSTLNATFKTNTITAGSPNQGNQGIQVSRASTSTLTFDVDGNTVTGMISTLINVFSGSGPGTATGDVKNNICTGTGVGGNQVGIRVFNSGTSALGQGTINANVSNNTVSNIDNAYPIMGESSNSSGSGGQLKIAVTGNNASVVAGGTALDSIRVQARNTSTVCAKVSGNTTNSGGPGFYGIQVRQANTSTFDLEGLTIGPQVEPTVHNYLVSQNPAAATVSSDGTVTGTITGVATGSCGITP